MAHRETEGSFVAQDAGKPSVPRLPGEPISLVCRDGVILRGHFWPARTAPVASVIVNPATGVLARYYHYYADFLAGEGFDVLTYDYRGIGLSRPPTSGGAAIAGGSGANRISMRRSGI